MFKVASTDLINMGIMVISYTIKEITDDVGYLKALGQGRTAEVQRDARIGEAKAKMESSIAEAKVSFYTAHRAISVKFRWIFWDNIEGNFEDNFRDNFLEILEGNFGDSFI